MNPAAHRGSGERALGWLLIACFAGAAVGAGLFVVAGDDRQSFLYKTGGALFFGGLGALLLVGAAIWATNVGALRPAGAGELVGRAGQFTVLAGVAVLLLVGAVSMASGTTVIEGSDPAIKLPLGLLALGVTLLSASPPALVAQSVRSWVDPWLEISPRLSPLFSVLAIAARAVGVMSGLYLGWRVAVS